MAFRNQGNPYFKPLSTDRLFTATASIVPKDRRRYLQGHGNMLSRKPAAHESSSTVVQPPQADAHGKQEARLYAAFQRFVDRDSPGSFAGSRQGKPTSFGSVHKQSGGKDLWAEPKSPSRTAPSRLSDASPAEPCAKMQNEAASHFMRYDSVQHSWFQHPAGLNSVRRYHDAVGRASKPVHANGKTEYDEMNQVGGKLGAYRLCMGEPPYMVGRDYIRPQTSRDTRSDQLRKLTRVYPQKSKDDGDVDQDGFRREMQGTPPLSTNCTWQTFRSNKTDAFPNPPHEYILKDYILRDVTHR